MCQVIFVNRYFHPDSSATSQALSDLVRRLGQRGLRIRVLTSRQLYEDAAAALPRRETVDDVQVQRLWSTRFGRDGLTGRAADYVTFMFSVGWQLLKILRRGDVVVAKTDPPLLSVVAAFVARLRRATLVNWLQDIFPEIARELGAQRWPAGMDRLLCRLRDHSLHAARANVVLGARMREKIVAWGVPEANVYVIENWADGELIAPLPVGQSRLRKEVVAADSFVVGYSGNLGRAHEFSTLVGAAELLRQEPGWVFLLIGGGARMAELRETVSERRLGGFRFLPYQPRAQLSDTLAAADVHLVSLRPALEGLIVPSKIYGILAAGRPVVFIGAPDGELGKLVSEAGCGVAVAANDSEGLARHLRELRADPQLRSAMADRARRTFLERYTANGAAEKWLDVLDMAAGGARDRSGRYGPRISPGEILR